MPDTSFARGSGDVDSDDNASDFSSAPRSPTSRVDSGSILVDSDSDGSVDTYDNCPSQSNPRQSDIDGDGFGDACDADDDGDGITDASDNCPTISNGDQIDSDGDGTGTACDADAYNRIAGIVTPLAGVPDVEGATDGLGSEATFYDVTSMTNDGESLLVSSVDWHLEGPPTVTVPPRSWVRKIDPATSNVTTLLTPQDFAAFAASEGSTWTKFYLNNVLFSANRLFILAQQCEDRIALIIGCKPRLLTYNFATSEMGSLDARMPAPGGPEPVWADTAIDGANLYVTENYCDTMEPSRIIRVPLDGAQPSVLSRIPKPDSGVAACGTLGELDYRQGDLFVTDRFRMHRVNPDTGDSTQIPIPEGYLNFPSGLVATEGVVFVAPSGDPGPVWAVDRVSGQAHETFAGSQQTSNQIETPFLGVGPETIWAPGAMTEVGGKLYVADRTTHGERFSGWAFHFHLIRRVEILPDAIAPEGSARLADLPATEAVRKGYLARSSSAQASSGAVRLAARDLGEGRIPSGLRQVQFANDSETGGWQAVSAIVTPDGLSAPATKFRLRDKVSNVSAWKQIVRSAPGSGNGGSIPGEDPPGNGGGSGPSTPGNTNPGGTPGNTNPGGSHTPIRPAKPIAKISASKKGLVRASIRPKSGVTYSIVARSARRGASSVLSASKTIRGRCARKSSKQVSCTIRLRKGYWTVSITPSRSGVKGTPLSRTFAVR
jgi:hypothetical protein